MATIFRRSRAILALVSLLSLGVLGGVSPGLSGDELHEALWASLMACSNSTGAIAPCTSTATVSVNSTGNLFIVTITNNSGGFVEGNTTCATTAPVTACTMMNGTYSLNGHTSMTDTALYDVGASPGTGTVTVTTGGFIGTLTATRTVTVTVPPYAVLLTPKNQPQIARDGPGN